MDTSVRATTAFAEATDSKGSRLTLQRVRKIAYSLRFLVGLSTGLYILVYLAAIGGAASVILGVPSKIIGLAALALSFLVEYFLELMAGALADKHGTKSTFVVSFFLRGVFTTLLAVLFVWSPLGSVLGMLIGIVGTMSIFAIAFTLFSGNYEEWLRQQCTDYQEGSTAFAWSEVLFYIGLALGAVTALLLTTGPALIASSAISLCAALICATIPSKKRSSQTTNRSSISAIKGTLKGTFGYIRTAKHDLHRSLPDLNVSFWAYAVVYGITQVIEGLTPLVYLSTTSKGYPLSTKLLILVGCLWLPSLLGASAKLYPGRFIYFSTKPREAVSSKERRLGSLRLTCVFYCAACLLVAVSSFVPESVRLVSFTVALICARISFGILRPLFFNYNASRVKEFYDGSTDDGSTGKDIAAPKTLLSIAEQRAKIGAILAISLTAGSEWMWGSTGVDGSSYLGIGITAIGLALYVIIKLRPAR
jgi:hypothetical protein